MFPPDANEALRQSFPQKYNLLKMLSDAGAGLLIGTDTMVPYLVPGFTPIDEMQHFVRAGLTPYQALRAGTRDAARFLGVEKESGTIAVGKRADLLLVDANPLDDPSNLWGQVGVMLNGRWLPKAELTRMLERMAATYEPVASRSPAPGKRE
jgi:imidazolonepropionase-like amidohydrolase